MDNGSEKNYWHQIKQVKQNRIRGILGGIKEDKYLRFHKIIEIILK